MKNGLKWTIVVALVVAIILCCSVALADVTIDDKNFKDPVFRQYILDEIDDGDGILSDDEIASTRSIWVVEKGITSLTGIEYFTALEDLVCESNQLKTLDIRSNTALERLDCHNNKLTDLDVRSNTRLNYLSCGNSAVEYNENGNHFESLDVSMNPALTYLECDRTKLPSLDVTQNTELESLNCNGNQLAILNVSQNINLKMLNCMDNQLKTLDVSSNPNLSQLFCTNNQLTVLDVSKNTALEYLRCYFNKLTKLDVSNCPEIVKYVSSSYYRFVDAYYYSYITYYKYLEILSCDVGVQIIGGSPVTIEWNDPTYIWADDNSTVTATRFAKESNNVKQTETVNTTSVEIKAATCEEVGETQYSAVFENQAFTMQTKTVEVPALGHDWQEPSFIWVKDLSSCTAMFRCGRCDIQETVPATVNSEVTVKPTQEAEGVRIYTATVTFDTKTYTDTQRASIEKLPEGVYIELNNTGKNGAATVTMYGAECFIVPKYATDVGLSDITYKSAKKKIATIDSTGKLTLLSAGKTTITVTAIQEVQSGKKIKKKKITASITLTVVDPTIPTSISIDQGASITMYLGKPVPQLTVSAQPAETASNAVTWKSSSAKVLKVDKNTGALTPVKAGTAKITATSTKNKKAKATITVTVVDLTVPAGIAITAPATEVAVKGTLQLDYELLRQDPEVPAKSAVTWKTKNKKIVTVSKTGLVKGIKEGTVVITATTAVGKKVAEITLTVKAPTGAEGTVELPDIEPVIDDPAFDEPVLEEPAVDEPSDEPVIPEEPVADMEWSDWYGEAPAADGAEQYEEF